MIEPSQRIQEAHGLWELQIARLASAVEHLLATNNPSVSFELVRDASKAEREAFTNWQSVSKECGA